MCLRACGVTHASDLALLQGNRFCPGLVRVYSIDLATRKQHVRGFHYIDWLGITGIDRLGTNGTDRLFPATALKPESQRQQL